jgi:hypothetical protein
MSESTSDLLREASDPTTPATRLSELLDICDAPRREFAALVGAALTKPPWGGRAEGLEHANSYLKDAAHDGALAAALAGNPNLSREDWVRALEIAPAAAIRSPLLKLLLAQRIQIIESFWELAALGALAEYAIAHPEDAQAPLALVDLVCAGLQELVGFETYGGNFGEMEHSDMPVTAANRYCWNGDGLWSFRAVAVHRAGIAVMDLLQRTTAEGAAEALSICDSLGSDLTRQCKWRNWECGIPFAPATENKFTHELITLMQGADIRVIGWSGPDGVHWVSSPRPGFRQGSASKALPKGFPSAWETTTCDLSGETNDLGIEVLDGEVTMIFESSAATDYGCAELRGCRIDKPFPKDQLKRLAMLFGEKSDAVRFGKCPKQSICDECGGVSLGWYVGEECGECGATRETED